MPKSEGSTDGIERHGMAARAKIQRARSPSRCKICESVSGAGVSRPTRGWTLTAEPRNFLRRPKISGGRAVCTPCEGKSSLYIPVRGFSMSMPTSSNLVLPRQCSGSESRSWYAVLTQCRWLLMSTVRVGVMTGGSRVCTWFAVLTWRGVSYSPLRGGLAQSRREARYSWDHRFETGYGAKVVKC
jgi:hypothetical protein